MVFRRISLKNISNLYTNIRDLDKIQVYQEENTNNSNYIELEGIPQLLTYGKHYFQLNFLRN